MYGISCIKHVKCPVPLENLKLFKGYCGPSLTGHSVERTPL